MPILALSFFLTFILLKISLPFLSKFIPDKPNNRSSHKLITPSSGGISFVITILIIGAYLNQFIWFLSLPLAMIGLIDDRFKISAIIRYIAQLLTVFLIVLVSVYPDLYPLDLNDIFLIVFLIIFGTAIINFVNFMDGIDGLVAGCFLVLTFTVSILFDLSLTFLPLSLLAFLFFNWHPAKVFMGDIGSTFLGSLLVTLIFNQANNYDAFRILSICFPLFIDAFLTLIRRILYNQNIFKPHKSHLYQRLCLSNWKHSKVAIIYIFFTSLISISCFLNSWFFIALSLIITFISGIIINRKYALPFKDSLV